MRNKNIYLVVGQLALAAGILLSHFMKDSEPVSFLVGFFVGLSIVFNLVYAFTLRKGNNGPGS